MDRKKDLDLTTLPIGTEVWYLGEDKGVIDEILPDPNNPYPVCVGFKEWCEWFTVNGCIKKGSAPVLFLHPFELVIPDEAYELPAPPDPPIDTVCYVADEDCCSPDDWMIAFWKGRNNRGKARVAYQRRGKIVEWAHVRFTDPYLEDGKPKED